MSENKTAILLTGAAARISQETAALDILEQKLGLKATEVYYLAGFSSGSLNIAGINARKKDENNWQVFKNLLFSLTNEDVIIRRKDENEGLTEAEDEALEGIHLKSIYDTSPLRKTIEGFLSDSGIINIRDFQCRTDILTCEIESLTQLKTRWVKTTIDRDKTYKIEDVLMCSTAIPVLFPWQKIHPHSDLYWDGGTKGTFDGYEKNIPIDADKFYIISPQRYTLLEELENLHLPKIVKEEIKKHFDCGNKQFWKFVNNFNNHFSDKEVYVCYPENLPTKHWDILDFTREEDQYKETLKYYTDHPEQIAMKASDWLKKTEPKNKDW